MLGFITFFSNFNIKDPYTALDFHFSMNCEDEIAASLVIAQSLAYKLLYNTASSSSCFITQKLPQKTIYHQFYQKFG